MHIKTMNQDCKKRNPIIELVSIGTELLDGTKSDGDFVIIAQCLQKNGYRLSYHSTVGDDAVSLKEAFATALKRADILISTGGLGPTTDDITRDVLSDLMTRDLTYNEEIASWVSDHFAARGISMPESNRAMALLPSGAEPIRNMVGNAPGLILHNQESLLYILPGPPFEMKPMFEGPVIGHIKNRFTPEVVTQKIYKITGLPESGVQQMIIDSNLDDNDRVDFVYLASPGDITLKVSVPGDGRILKEIGKKIRDLFGIHVYGTGEALLEEVVGKLLKEKNMTVAVAESCTGGLTAARITDISGSSDYFLLGMVTYSNEAKITGLGVPEETIQHYGAVSSQTAEAMARGIVEKSGAAIGVSITGIAGPTGGSGKKPVGLVYFCLADKAMVRSEKCLFPGNRHMVKQSASQYALNMIRKYLIDE